MGTISNTRDKAGLRPTGLGYHVPVLDPTPRRVCQVQVPSFNGLHIQMYFLELQLFCPLFQIPPKFVSKDVTDIERD